MAQIPAASTDPSANALARPASAWLFDVDGVLTDPELKRVTHPAIYDELIARLRKGEPVGLNTGRSLHFIEGVLAPLEARLKDMEDKRLLRHLVAIGEKGSAQLTYQPDGTHATRVDPLVVPATLREEVRALAREAPFASCMFFDETKQTMVSLELREGHTLAEFEPRQRALVGALRRILEHGGWQEEFRIDPTRIATDVEHRHVGKAQGAARFVAWLAAQGIDPLHYVCFGDSPSDYDMLGELLRLGKSAELIFVGGEQHLDGKDTRRVTFTRLPCDAGTLSYLQSHR